MKNINSFSNFISEDIEDNLMKDIEQVGFKEEFLGYFITFIFYGNDGISNSALAVTGNKFESIALNILNDFALDESDVDIESLSSIEDLMEAINEHYENSGENWNFFEYKYVEMSPKKKENSFKSSQGLLDIGKVIEIGRNTFSDFDSKIFNMKG
jgi:hypothetical protein